MEFLYDNIGTIIVGTVVAGIIAAVIGKVVRDKKKGGCAGCSCGVSDKRPDCRRCGH